MIWVAWRQFRTQALVDARPARRVRRARARDGPAPARRLQLARRRALQRARRLRGAGIHDKALADLLGPALLAIPALLGMFWGAPLVARELESGTYRLAWTQSVTRRRWLSVRVALVGVAALAVAGLASWLVSWWFAPLDAVNMNRFDPSVFTARGVVAIGYAGFAFALGVATGTLTRRTLPAMAATLLGFVAARIAFTLWVRPHLLPTKHVLVPADGREGPRRSSGARRASASPAGAPPIPNAWMVSAAVVDRAHHALSTAQLHDSARPHLPDDRGPRRTPAVPARAAAGVGLQRANARSRITCSCSSPTSHQATTGRCRHSKPGSSSPPRCSDRRHRLARRAARRTQSAVPVSRVSGPRTRSRWRSRRRLACVLAAINTRTR